jgi:hypothetical protein
MTAFMCVAPLCVYVVLVVFMQHADVHAAAAFAFGLCELASVGKCTCVLLPVTPGLK